MARNLDLLVCLFIMVMDVVAGILGIQAEVAENKVCLENWVLLKVGTIFS